MPRFEDREHALHVLTPVLGDAAASKVLESARACLKLDFAPAATDSRTALGLVVGGSPELIRASDWPVDGWSDKPCTFVAQLWREPLARLGIHLSEDVESLAVFLEPIGRAHFVRSPRGERAVEFRGPSIDAVGLSGEPALCLPEFSSEPWAHLWELDDDVEDSVDDLDSHYKAGSVLGGYPSMHQTDPALHAIMQKRGYAPGNIHRALTRREPEALELARQARACATLLQLDGSGEELVPWEEACLLVLRDAEGDYHGGIEFFS